MMKRLFSNDLPRSRLLAALLILIVVSLALAPFLFPGVRSLNVAAKICVFIVLIASYDLLLGYTGIVSFGHTLFFGMGAYGVAIALSRMGPSWTAVATGVGVGLLASLVISFLLGMFSLRVRAIFYAMVTLVMASAFQILASQMSELTGGEDGLTLTTVTALAPGTVFSSEPFLGVALDGRLLSYYIVFGVSVVLFLVMLRIVNSPFGRVLQAIRENDFRADALGYRVVVYRTLSSMLSASFATLAGALLALWLRYNSPDTSLAFGIMVDILLMVVIGGVGTMYGAVIGPALLILAQSYLQDLMLAASKASAGLPVIGAFMAALFSPDRWLLWLGVLFVLSVYYFPTGFVGQLRKRR
jgi:branched-chain amino acid transport system permease protein